ncbi:amino acid adenylation domain-containing protein, partial [Acidobacteriota bacterium]
MKGILDSIEIGGNPVESASYFDKLASTAGQEINLEDYWINKLSGDPGKTGFPYDNKKIDEKGSQRWIERAKFQFTGGDYEKLMKLSNGSHPRLHMILIAGLVSLLFKYSSNKDIIVGTSIYKQDIEGEFINTVLALRNQLQDDITFKELLLQVRQVLAEAVENQNYPIELLLQKLGIPFSTMDDFPLFDIAVLLENIQSRTYIRHINPNMFFFFLETGESVEGVVAYNSALYEIETIKRVCVHFKQLLHQVLFNIDLPLANIDILTGEEKRRLLVEFNDTEGKYPKHKSITGLFQQQVGKTPDHIAVVYKDYQVAYKELNEKSHRLSMILRKKGAATDTIVGLMAAPSPELIIGILGILKAGAAYLPLDPENPGTRIEFILKDSDARTLVTTGNLNEDRKIEGWEGEKVLLDTEGTPDKENHPHLPTWVNAPVTSMAYIIYTSGTTGKPKGVIIDHQGLVNYTWWAAAKYVKNKTRNFPLFTSLSFDLTITSIFTPLITGNAIVVYGNDDEDNVMLIEKIIDDNKVEAVKLTPSHLRLVREKRMNSSGIKCFIVGGEELDASLAGDINRNFKNNIDIYNEYGPTETVVGCMCYRFNRETDTGKSVSIGIPINNMQVYILDIHHCPVPPGAVGELYISGDGMARGYLNNPELTNDKFLIINDKLKTEKESCGQTLNAFNQKFLQGGPGGTVFTKGVPPGRRRQKKYKTGDLARWLAHRNIEFLGRIDHQVKIRGYRIELGEIESLLLQHDKIKEALVTLHGDNSEDRCLCAYVVLSGSDPGLPGEFDVSKLKAHLAEKLPEYMLPSFFINLEHLPLTPSGKIDRKNLPGPEITLDKYVPPGNELEEKLVGIWSEVLTVKKERIGINSSFFDLGGSSLKATLLVSRIHKAFNTRVSLLDVFKTPTIEGLSKIIIEAGKSRPSPGKTGAWSEEFISIQAAEKKEYYPASSAQKRLFILRQMEGQRPVYNVTLVMELQGELDSRKLEGTFRTLTRRHESLRTSFRMMEEKLVQQIHDREDFSIQYHESASVERIIRDFSKVFDLLQAPLMRVGLVKMNAQQRILIIEMHHIISDGISVEVFARESMKLYSGEELPPLKLQYRDFSLWRNSAREKQVLEKQGKYWAKEFKEEPPGLDLPYDYPRPLVKSFEGSTLHFQMGKEETEKLKKIASDESVTLYMILLTIYTIFLSKLCSQEEIVVGTPVAGRRHAELQEIIGVFINTLALGNRPAGEKTFPVFLKEVKNRTLEAFENQDYPFEELVDNLVKNRDISRNPLFDVMFVLQDTGNPEVKIPALKLTPFPYETQISRFELMLYVLEVKDTIFFQFDYSTALFKEATIERFGNYLKKIVAAIIENLGVRLGNIEIITAEEKQRVLFEFNNTEVDYPREMTLHELFVHQVEQRPNHVALVGTRPLSITYGELNERSHQLAG